MKYKLLCIDIDGTLLDDKKRIPASVKESLKRASDMGCYIALASGRMPVGVEIIEEKLGIDCIKICNAGAYILMGGKCIGEECLSLASMKGIYEKVAKKNKVPLWIFRDKDWYVTNVDKYVEREVRIIPYIPEIVNVEELAAHWQSEGRLPNKLLIAADPEILKSIHYDMESGIWQDVDMACSSDRFIEIFPAGVNKGKALETICRHLDIGTEEVMAFGDQELDIPMLETAGMGIAVGNAIPELKEKADFVTKSNNEAGIAYALEQYFK